MGEVAAAIRRGTGAPRLQIAILGALVALQLGLRIGLALRERFDTDEPQHFHVAWAWLRGSLPHRDVFDNHPPSAATRPFIQEIHLDVLEVAANEDFSLLRRHLPPSSAPLELLVR